MIILPVIRIERHDGRSRTPSLTSRRRRKMAGVDGCGAADGARVDRGELSGKLPAIRKPVFRKDHAQTKSQSGTSMLP